jgi:predicted phage terminase large subunit-like protein
MANLANLDTLPDEVLKEILALTEAKKKLEIREKATDSFMTFAHHVYENFIEGEHHRIIAEKLERVARGELKRLIINMPPRHALDIKEKILTTEGWKTIETLQVGDFVFGSDGLPTRVTGKSEVFRSRKLYRAVSTDGASVVCDGEHLWTVRVQTTDKPDNYRTVSTDHLIEANYRHGPYLPLFPPLNAGEKCLPVPPYVLGAWLGDGASSCGTMAAHPDDAKHIRARFEALGVETTTTSWDMTFGTKGLMVKLRKLGVLNNKHIPESYLFASPEQRLELLQGLIDTDGDVTKQGKVTFNSSNRLLADQVCFLVRSFGLRAQVTARDTGFFGGYKSRPSYRVMFKMAGAASLPRKALRCRDKQTYRARSIRFEDCGIGDTQCITVDREDGLFLAGEGLILTHNSKSEFASFLMPAWFLGRNPKLKIIQATHNTELAVRFGRKVRDLIDDPAYKDIFPSTNLKEDNKGAGKWGTDKGGEYFAAGVGAAVTGRGADLFIIDDPHSEQDAMSESAFDNAYEWYTSGPRQRLQPGGAIILVMTRWGKKDLTGRLLANQSSDPMADQWEVVEFPALLPSGRPLWPEFWDKDALLSIKASLPLGKWAAQWQQQPTSEGSAIVRKEWWRRWEKEKIPPLKYIIQAYDTAFSKKETADYSAITTWGVFEPEEGTRDNIILLDAQRGRWNFPELKEVAFEEHQYWEPDMVIVEAKATGKPLIDELRARGIPALGFSPGRRAGGGGVDKTTRMHMVSPLFEAGLVWAPDDKRFAEEVIEEVTSFPNGDHDDFCDSMTLALIRFRQGGFVTIHDEERLDFADQVPRKREYY